MSKQTSQVDEPLLKKQLRAVIVRKKTLLAQLTVQIEITRSELTTIKAEYDRRIGLLYEKLDELDEQIFELKKLHDLLQKKIPLKEAKRLLAERERVQAERESARAEAEEQHHAELTEKAKKMKPTDRDALKKLWRRLAFRFHPDLVHEDNEKKFRESMMKRVNEAYARCDLASLKAIDSEETSSEQSLADATMDELEQSLMDTEACIRRVRQKLKAFKKLEWYSWKKGIEEAKKNNQDFFASLEKNTRKHIKEKEKTITELEKAVSKFN